MVRIMKEADFLRVPNVSNKNVGCPVKFKFQINSKQFLYKDVPNVIRGILIFSLSLSLSIYIYIN